MSIGSAGMDHSETAREERVEVKNCPLCHKKHFHTLQLRMHTVESLMAIGPSWREFEVFLTCPNKDETFKSRIRVKVWPFETVIRIREM